MDARIKIKIKLIPEALFLLHSIFRTERRCLEPKPIVSQNQELFLMLTTKCNNYMSSANGKPRTLSLWYHQAERILFAIIKYVNNPHLGVFEKNQLEKLKNELHQKLL